MPDIMGLPERQGFPTIARERALKQGDAFLAVMCQIDTKARPMEIDTISRHYPIGTIKSKGGMKD